MNILVTNDDGYFAPGLKALAKALHDAGHNVTVMAPHQENSGMSHSITFLEALKVSPVTIEGLDVMAYSVSGTPADCVRAAVNILNRKFDFCFSGCNNGYNAGMDVLYSGTVSAAVEANLFNINAIAVSTEFKKTHMHYDTSARVALEVFDKIKDTLEPVQVVNINVPSMEYEKLSGIRAAKLGGVIQDHFDAEPQGDGFNIHLMRRDTQTYEKGTDRYLLQSGYATVTPLVYDFNNPALLHRLRDNL
ncbi:5'/3'-nucleotidase SurE [Peptoniphilus equinus]|uniref:5'-nucleotidase SurE n=1 Tax=Peptoniphilus equinus TaxID=3016343 RepID=A0ABY7QV91_9FIRM|nr:5'/3'-nucleotidase SurE [Peptoniphilus equinus]WBW49960.1 5'/3'-nucleotidase SurE [Peptoniphilus equinus]